jgi:hypothetical protein
VCFSIQENAKYKDMVGLAVRYVEIYMNTSLLHTIVLLGYHNHHGEAATGHKAAEESGKNQESFQGYWEGSTWNQQRGWTTIKKNRTAGKWDNNHND